MGVTSTLTKTRTTSGGGRDAAPDRWATPAPAGRRLTRVLVLLVAAGLMVTAGAWGLGSARDDHHGAAALSGGVAIPGGLVRVDGSTDRSMGHAMQGMSMSDMGAEDVPVGLRRFSVNVSMVATGDQALQYDVEDFLVSGPGVAPVPPVQALLGPGTVPPGRALTGTLTFDVPEEATEGLVLRVAGSEPLALPTLPALGHGDEGHDGAPPAGATEEPATTGGHDEHDH